MLSLRWLVCSFGCDRVSSRLLVGCFQLLLFPVAMRLFLRVATRCPAVNAHSPGCRVVALVVCCAMRSVCEGRLAGSRLQLLCCGRTCSRLLYTTIHHPFFHVCHPYTTHTLSHTHRSHLHATRNSHAVHHTHTALTTHLPDITPPTPRTSHTHHIHTTPHPLTTHHIHHAPHPPH